MEKQTYSVKEVAELLGIGLNLAYQLVQQGEIQSIKLGFKRRVVPKAVIDKLLQNSIDHRRKII